MYFWKTYPSCPFTGKTSEDLTIEFKTISCIAKKDKAEMILDCVQNDGETFREYQKSRDFITTSLVRDLEHQKEEHIVEYSKRTFSQIQKPSFIYFYVSKSVVII